MINPRPDGDPVAMARVAAITPVLNERAAITEAIAQVPRDLCHTLVVVDGGSWDGTPELARSAGALVVIEPQRGYGRAVMRGLEVAATMDVDAYIIFDANGSVSARDIQSVLAPIMAMQADVSIGVRPRERLRLTQRFGNRLAIEIIAQAFAFRYGDIGSIRAVSRAALERLDLFDEGYGWPLQLQARAAADGLRLAQVPVWPQPRVGRSKVSGTLRGRVGAGLAFGRVLSSECLRHWSRSLSVVKARR